MNHYANKKSAAESMLDIALLMANASQLKAVIEQGPSFAFFIPLVVLISISLVLQVGVGVLLIFLGMCLGRRPSGGRAWDTPAPPSADFPCATPEVGHFPDGNALSGSSGPCRATWEPHLSSLGHMVQNLAPAEFPCGAAG